METGTVQPKKKLKVKPTDLQLRAFELAKIHPKWSLGKVMREAGFSKSSSRSPKQQLLDRRGFINAQALWPDALAGRGIHIQRLAEKYEKLLDAKKSMNTRWGIEEVDDPVLQFKVAESLKKDLGISPDGPKTEEKSVTFTWKKPI